MGNISSSYSKGLFSDFLRSYASSVSISSIISDQGISSESQRFRLYAEHPTPPGTGKASRAQTASRACMCFFALLQQGAAFYLREVTLREATFYLKGGGIEQTFAKEFSFVAAGEREHYELTEKRKERTLWSFSTIMTWLTSEKSHK